MTAFVAAMLIKSLEDGEADLMNFKECNAVVIYMYSLLNCRHGEVRNARTSCGHRQHATSAWNERHCGDECCYIYDHGGSRSFLDVAI